MNVARSRGPGSVDSETYSFRFRLLLASHPSGAFASRSFIKTTQWWVRRPKGLYFPQISFEDFQRVTGKLLPSLPDFAQRDQAARTGQATMHPPRPFSFHAGHSGL